MYQHTSHRIQRDRGHGTDKISPPERHAPSISGSIGISALTVAGVLLVSYPRLWPVVAMAAVLSAALVRGLRSTHAAISDGQAETI